MKHPSKRKNFTMVEIMVVVAIIAILVGMGMAGYKIARKRADETNTKAALLKLKIAIESFKKKYGYYPQGGTYCITIKDIPDIYDDRSGVRSKANFTTLLIPVRDKVNSSGTVINDIYGNPIKTLDNENKFGSFLNLKDLKANSSGVYRGNFTSSSSTLDEKTSVSNIDNTTLLDQKLVVIDRYPVEYSGSSGKLIKMKGRPIVYVVPGDVHTDGYDLYSAGPDGAPGSYKSTATTKQKEAIKDNIWVE